MQQQPQFACFVVGGRLKWVFLKEIRCEKGTRGGVQTEGAISTQIIIQTHLTSSFILSYLMTDSNFGASTEWRRCNIIISYVSGPGFSKWRESFREHDDSHFLSLSSSQFNYRKSRQNTICQTLILQIINWLYAKKLKAQNTSIFLYLASLNDPSPFTSNWCCSSVRAGSS